MSEHTPGPWSIDEATRTAEICTIHHCGTERGWCYIRGALGYWTADEAENWANAQLIAAAPDLLEALHLAQTQLQTLRYRHGSSGDGMWDEERQAQIGETVDHTKAAIAKARGTE